MARLAVGFKQLSLLVSLLVPIQNGSTVITVGDHDECDPSLAREMNALIPGSKLVILPAGPQPDYAVVLDRGLPLALWQEAARCQLAQKVDQLCPKRSQGLSTGDYIRLAAINRACDPVSKQAMWDWVSQTCLPRLWPQASAALLTSQHFWDHMDRIEAVGGFLSGRNPR